MNLLQKSSIALVALAALGAGAMHPAAAQTPLTWTGSGASGTDPYAQGWSYTNPLGTPGWGIPGLGSGILSWSGPDLLNSFDITFTGLPAGVSVSTNTNTSDFNATRFENVSTGTFFNASVIGTDEVQFTGDSLAPGDSFFVNVAFAGGDPAGSAFVAKYNGGNPVPEASSSVGLGLLLALGVGGMVAARRKTVKA